jgi:hypothetical protein
VFRPRALPVAFAASLAAVVLAVPAAQAVQSGPAGGTTPTTRPQPLPPPDGHRLVATYFVGTGSQTYECLPDAVAGPTWRGRPVAVLVATDGGGSTVGTHDSVAPQGSPSVPQWSLVADGSRVAARLAAGGSFPAPDPTKAIPALRLDVIQNSGAGRLADVDLIQRDLTRGGVGPSGACDPATAQPVISTYYARYTFWARTS